MLLSIVIPVYNQLDATRNCITSIDKYTSTNKEIIIVDDQSTLSCQQELKTLGTYVRTPYRAWHSEACNIGIQHSKGNYICLLNSDTLVSPSWDSKLINFLEANLEVSCTGPSTSYSASHQQLPSLNKKRLSIKLNHIEKYANAISLKYKDQSELTRITGFCMMFKKETLQTVGLLDKTMFPSAGNEFDWLIRALKLNLSPYWIKDSYVHHYGQLSYNEALGNNKGNRWSSADLRLISKHGNNWFNKINKELWLNQKYTY